MNTIVTKRFTEPRADDRDYRRRHLSHVLDLRTARQWTRDDILGNPSDITGQSAYTRWKFTLEAWAQQRIQEGHLTAAALIIELLNAGTTCRIYGTNESVDRVAELWVRCHNEAGVKCEDCR